MDEMPIIIFHLGNQPYLKLCLQQALKYNKNIININERDDMFPELNVKCVSYNKYNKNAEKFKPLYKNYSSNSPQLELICIIRWMYVYEYMFKHKIDKAFICDSDVLIYDNISHIYNKYLSNYDYMLCSSPSKNITGGQSIWTIHKLENFIRFIVQFYKTQINNIENFYKKYNEPGGICDMTLLYYFSNNATEFVGLRLNNYPYFKNDLTQIFNNELTFDLHMRTSGNHIYPEDYEMNGQNKNIKFIDNKPHCYCKRLDKNIRFVLLHFQGNNKQIMPNFARL